MVLMKPLRPLIRLWALAWYRRALKEMGADHKDAPYVVLRIREWEMQ